MKNLKSGKYFCRLTDCQGFLWASDIRLGYLASEIMKLAATKAIKIDAKVPIRTYSA